MFMDTGVQIVWVRTKIIINKITARVSGIGRTFRPQKSVINLLIAFCLIYLPVINFFFFDPVTIFFLKKLSVVQKLVSSSD